MFVTHLTPNFPNALANVSSAKNTHDGVMRVQ